MCQNKQYWIFLTSIPMLLNASECDPAVIAKAIEQSNFNRTKACLHKKDNLTGEEITAETFAYDSQNNYITLREIAANTTARLGKDLSKLLLRDNNGNVLWDSWKTGKIDKPNTPRGARRLLAQAKEVQYYLEGLDWIGFYDNDRPYFEFTNFARYPVQYNGYLWSTAEHAFQAAKFLPHRPDIAQEIKSASSPSDTIKIARQYKSFMRNDWHDNKGGYKNKAMNEIVYAKFDQHQYLRNLLLDTGDAYLEEFAPPDAEWGSGPDGTGLNKLGKALMKARKELREKYQKQPPPPAPQKQEPPQKPPMHISLYQDFTELHAALQLLQLAA